MMHLDARTDHQLRNLITALDAANDDLREKVLEGLRFDDDSELEVTLSLREANRVIKIIEAAADLLHSWRAP